MLCDFSGHQATDDEDFDNEISGSGTDEPIPKGPCKYSNFLYSSVKSTLHFHVHVTDYYRITLTVKEPYQKDYEQRTSPAFKGFAKQLGDAIDQLYANDPGRQSATVIKIQLVSLMN